MPIFLHRVVNQNVFSQDVFPIQKGPCDRRNFRCVSCLKPSWTLLYASTKTTLLGIGRALAEKFIENGSYVIASGRREQNLEELVHKYGHAKVSTAPFD